MGGRVFQRGACAIREFAVDALGGHGKHDNVAFCQQPDPGKYQTAWSSMALLTKKDLVIRKGHPPRYSLSDEGLELAERMMKADDPAFVPFFNIQGLHTAVEGQATGARSPTHVFNNASHSSAVEKVAPAPPAKEPKPKKQSVKKKQYLPAELFGDDESPARRGMRRLLARP